MGKRESAVDSQKEFASAAAADRFLPQVWLPAFLPKRRHRVFILLRRNTSRCDFKVLNFPALLKEPYILSSQFYAFISLYVSDYNSDSSR
jgi:hypothetical protein